MAKKPQNQKSEMKKLKEEHKETLVPAIGWYCEKQGCEWPVTKHFIAKKNKNKTNLEIAFERYKNK